MITMRDTRRLALSFPEATEEDHHGIPSYRVRGKIFATVPDDEHVRVMLGPEEIDAAISADPTAFEELWWGKQLVGVLVNLRRADRERVFDLLTEAWGRKAPRRLVAEFDGTAPRGGRKSKRARGSTSDCS